jgi:hypothetical protein
MYAASPKVHIKQSDLVIEYVLHRSIKQRA